MTELELESERSVNIWTPGTLRNTANQVTEQLTRLAKVNTKIAMAREAEKTRIECMMEMMLQMRAEDKKEAQIREDKRYRKERQREVDRLEREARREIQEKMKSTLNECEDQERIAQKEREEREREDNRTEREARQKEE